MPLLLPCGLDPRVMAPSRMPLAYLQSVHEFSGGDRAEQQWKVDVPETSRCDMFSSATSPYKLALRNAVNATL